MNSSESVRARFAAGAIPRYAPLFVLFARPALALVAQALTILLLALLAVHSPTVASRHWWSVYGTLVDVGCLALLYRLTRREGIRILDLVSFDKGGLKVDIPLGLGIFLVVFPLTVFVGGQLGSLIAYGNLEPAFPEGAFVRALPLFAVLYSRVLWWPLWSFTEELTYQGYVLPRLQSLTRSTWATVAVVAFAWSLQHSVLPWSDSRQALYLFITFVPLTIALQLVYLRVRRLMPLIVGHWLMDLVAVVFMLRVK